MAPIDLIREFIRESLLLEIHNDISYEFLVQFAKNVGISVAPGDSALANPEHASEFNDHQKLAEWTFHELAHLVLAGMDLYDLDGSSMRGSQRTLPKEIDARIQSFKNHWLNDKQEVDASAIAFNVGKQLALWSEEARLPFMRGSLLNMTSTGMSETTDDALMNASQSPFVIKQARYILDWLRGWDG